MDESWRIPIGSVVPRRRSTEQPRRPTGGLDPDDFRDVFGGPPRSLLLRQFSGGDLTSSSSSASSHFDRLQRYYQPSPRRRPSFYEEVFQQQPREETGSHETWSGRSLPNFTIPTAVRGGGRRNERGGGGWEVRMEDGFYDDIFGSERRSRTRSRQSTSKTKSNASSVLSSEEGGELVSPPLRSCLTEDGVITSFASKLRPITIPSRRCSSPSPTLPYGEEQISSHRTSTVPCPRPCLMNFRFDEVTGPNPCGVFRPYSPPGTVIGIEPKRATATADDHSDSDSPSSAVSSIYDIPMATIRPVGSHEVVGPLDLEKEVAVVLEQEEADSEYVIEIMPGRKVAKTEASAVMDEAIAWAKEKFRASSMEGIGVGEDQKQD